MRRLALGLSSALSLLATACAASAEQAPGAPSPAFAPTPEQVEQGRITAGTLCARCHATGSAAESPNPAAPPLRTLAERYPSTLLVDAFPERMRNGHPAMPDFGLTDAQVQALLAYLLSIQERQGA